MFAKADSLVDQDLSCPRIELSILQILKLDVVETGVLLSDFAQKNRRSIAYVTDIYFTSLDASGICLTLVLNQNAETKATASWVPLKNERQKLQSLYTQGSAAYESTQLKR